MFPKKQSLDQLVDSMVTKCLLKFDSSPNGAAHPHELEGCAEILTLQEIRDSLLRLKQDGAVGLDPNGFSLNGPARDRAVVLTTLDELKSQYTAERNRLRRRRSLLAAGKTLGVFAAVIAAVFSVMGYYWPPLATVEQSHPPLSRSQPVATRSAAVRTAPTTQSQPASQPDD